MGIEEMRNAVRGRVLLPGDAGFDQAVQPWNLAVAQPVSGVVAVADADDAADLVKFARSANRRVVTQTTGHGATGGIEDAILIRTGPWTVSRSTPSAGRPGSVPARNGVPSKPPPPRTD